MPLRPLHLLMLLTGLGLGGCASGGWMASLSDEELPLENASTPYPTAVVASQATPVAAEAEPEVIPEAEVAPETSSPPKPIPIRAAPIAPMAIVPSALRMNRTPDPIPIDMPRGPAKPPALPATPSVALASSAEPATEPGTAAVTQSVTNLAPIVSAADLHPPPPASTADVAPPIQYPSVTLATPQSPQPTSAELPLAPLPATTQSPDDRLAAILQQRNVLIAMLEDEIRQRAAPGANDPQLARLEQELRLLYAAAQRADDASRAIDALGEPEREAYKHLMFGLSTWLTEEEARRAPLRNARVLRSLREASSELAAASKLDLRNLAFCEKVESFGWFTTFTRNEFQPKQQVILYVEIDNFAALEKSPHSFETELQGNYQIFDARGSIVAERKLPLDREICRNYRRDYFLAYPIYLPDSIADGRYRLELTIEDLKATGDYQGRKFGEGMVEFSVRN